MFCRWTTLTSRQPAGVLLYKFQGGVGTGMPNCRWEGGSAGQLKNKVWHRLFPARINPKWLGGVQFGKATAWSIGAKLCCSKQVVILVIQTKNFPKSPLSAELWGTKCRRKRGNIWMFRQSMELTKWRQLNLIRRAHCYVQIVVQTWMWGRWVKRTWQHIIIWKPAKLDMGKSSLMLKINIWCNNALASNDCLWCDFLRFSPRLGAHVTKISFDRRRRGGGAEKNYECISLFPVPTPPWF